MKDKEKRVECQEKYTINIDGLVKSPKIPFSVIPSRIGVRDDGQVGIHSFQAVADHLDSGFHRSNDFLQDH